MKVKDMASRVGFVTCGSAVLSAGAPTDAAPRWSVGTMWNIPIRPSQSFDMEVELFARRHFSC